MSRSVVQGVRITQQEIQLRLIYNNISRVTEDEMCYKQLEQHKKNSQGQSGSLKTTFHEH